MASQLANQLVASVTVEVSIDRIALWISVHVADWIAELAIIASNAAPITGSNEGQSDGTT